MPKAAKSGAEIAYVRWFDACITSPETRHPHDLPGVLEMETAGLLVAEDEQSITLALDRSITNGGLRSLLCIPRANVRKVTKLRA